MNNISRSFYRELLDNLHDGVYFLDKHSRIIYWNRGAERITGYMGPEVLGSRCSDNILNHVDQEGTPLCRKICPMAKTMRDGELRDADVFFNHREGHRVPVHVRVSPIRGPGGEIVGAVQIFTENWSKVGLVKQLEEYREMSLLDPLTSLGNRRYADIQLQSRLDEMHKYGFVSFGIIFLDIDRFKKVNDLYGHDNGDQVLKMVSMTLQNGIRECDVVCRWGGEEFLALVPTCSGHMLYSWGNKLRVLVEQSTYTLGNNIVSVTVSAGVTLAEKGDTVESLVKRADGLMYQSKKNGRNRVTANF